jgi:hypothetical protein
MSGGAVSCVVEKRRIYVVGSFWLNFDLVRSILHLIRACCSVQLYIIIHSTPDIELVSWKICYFNTNALHTRGHSTHTAWCQGVN